MLNPIVSPNSFTPLPNIGDTKLCINNERDAHIVNDLPVYSSVLLQS